MTPEIGSAESAALQEAETGKTEGLRNGEAEGSKYNLIYAADGVYLRVSAGAAAADREACRAYLKRKGLENVSDRDLQAAFEAADGSPLRIADACEEKILDDELAVEVYGPMSAAIVLVAGDSAGERMTGDKIAQILKDKYRIVFGLDMDAIGGFLTSRDFGRPMVAVRGREPVRGTDGGLTYHFTLDNGEKTYKIEEDGRINYRDRNKIDSVQEGQLLVTRTPAIPGEDGMDIYGKTLLAAKGREAVLPFGKNVSYSEDKLSLLAKISGHIEIINGKIFISPTYIVRGDVDMHVGNIDFDGDVQITGSVHSEFVVKASGNITIHGVVEAACIESGGDVILKKGIQGADKGTIRARGRVYSLFIHRTDVEAEYKVEADVILHSKIKCEGEVLLTDKNGLLVGGSVSAGKMLAARIIGAESGVATKIKLGISPRKREHYHEIHEELEQIRSGIERMDRALKSTIGHMTASEIRMEVTKKMLALQKRQVELEKELRELETQIAEAKDGTVHVLNKVYPGTRISIGASIYEVKTEEAYVTYHIRDGIISPEPCRYRDKA